jgi:acetylornithine deacetylase/succinyl-diaminopimelate desuccinylase-like protein
VRLSAGLVRLGAHDFTVALNPTARAYFEAVSKTAAPQVAADMRAVLDNPRDEAAVQRLWAVNPAWNAAMRTTCVVTQIQGGHADNALPQHVRAIVNCRILPGVAAADVQREIREVLADDRISVTAVGEPAMQSQAPPLSSAVLGPVQTVAARIWPGVPLVPTMSVGATDGRYLGAGGIPTYGLSGMFSDPDGSHAHGLDERIRVKSLLDGRRFLYEVVKIYANSKDVQAP